MLYSVFLFCFCSYIYFLLSFPERTTFVEILEKESLLSYTAISRKVVGKNVHATIPKGNVGYDQYTVPDTVAVEPTFAKFIQHLQTYFHDLSYHSFKFLWKTVNSRPPTIHFAVVACTLFDNLSRNSCIKDMYATVFVVDFLSQLRVQTMDFGRQTGFCLIDRTRQRRWAEERRVIFWSSYMLMLPGILLE